MPTDLSSLLQPFFEATHLATFIFDTQATLIQSAKNTVVSSLPHPFIAKLVKTAQSQITLINLPQNGTVAYFQHDQQIFVIWATAIAINGNGVYEDRIPLTDFRQFKAQVTLFYLALTQATPTFTEQQIDLADYGILDHTDQEKQRYREHTPSHSGYLAEQQMLLGVEHGNLSEFNANYVEFMNQGNFGVLAASDLRSKKNITVAATTLFTRAAIRGGMFAESAYDLSDECIKKTEQRNSITNIYEYTRTIGERFVRNVARVKRQNIPSLVYQAQEYIYDHLASIKTTSQIAEHVGCSTSYLMHLFKETTGVSVNQFLTAQRIMAAKQQLIFTQNSISDIADALGYSNQAQLSRTFKQATGASPLQFRKQQRL